MKTIEEGWKWKWMENEWFGKFLEVDTVLIYPQQHRFFYLVIEIFSLGLQVVI